VSYFLSKYYDALSFLRYLNQDALTGNGKFSHTIWGGDVTLAPFEYVNVLGNGRAYGGGTGHLPEKNTESTKKHTGKETRSAKKSAEKHTGKETRSAKKSAKKSAEKHTNREISVLTDDSVIDSVIPWALTSSGGILKADGSLPDYEFAFSTNNERDSEDLRREAWTKFRKTYPNIRVVGAGSAERRMVLLAAPNWALLERNLERICIVELLQANFCVEIACISDI
jgi:hypothetical protein